MSHVIFKKVLGEVYSFTCKYNVPFPEEMESDAVRKKKRMCKKYSAQSVELMFKRGYHFPSCVYDPSTC